MDAPDDTLDRLVAGIAQRESGGMRDPYGNITDAGRGRRVIGKYQVLTDNIPSWTKEALGQAMTPAQFRASPEAQDATARYKLGQYAAQYGPEGAAQAWLGGPGSVGKTQRADRFGTTVGQYGRDVMNYAGLSGQGEGQQAISSNLHPVVSSAIDNFLRASGGQQARPQTLADQPLHPAVQGAIDNFLSRNATAASQATQDDNDGVSGPVAASQSAPAAAPTGFSFEQPQQAAAPAAAPTGFSFEQPQQAPAAPQAAPDAPAAAQPPSDPGMLMAIQRGANTLLGGLPNMLTAGVAQIAGNGDPAGYTATLRALAERQELAAQNHPIAQAAGMALGAGPAIGAAALLPGAGAVTLPGRVAAGAALGGATGAGEGFSQTGTAGGALNGGLTGAAGGGVMGAVSPQIVPIAGAALGGLAGYNASGGSATGMLGGAVAGGAGAKAFGEVAAPLVRQYVTDAPTGPLRKGYDALAAIIRQPGESVAAVAARVRADVDEFKAVFGFTPNTAQLLERQQARELAKHFDANPTAIDTAQQAETATADRMQKGLGVNIEGLNNPTTKTAMANRASTEMTAALDAPSAGTTTPVRDMPVDPNKFFHPADPARAAAEQGALMRALHGPGGGDVKLADALDGKASFTVGDADELRQLATKAANANSATVADAAMFKGLADRITQATRQAAPEYGTALDQFAATMHRGAGAEVGATGMTAGPVAFQAAGEKAVREGGQKFAPDLQAGIGPGLRTELSQAATRGPAGAASTSNAITGNANVRQNLTQSLPPAEAARITRTAEIANKAGSAMSELAVAGKTDQALKENAADYATRAAVYGVMGHHFGMIHAIANGLKKAGIGAGAQLKLVQLATDPAQTAGVVRYLEGRGLGHRDAVEMTRRLAAIGAGGMMATQATAP
jgi:hypothetical protein